MWENFVRTHSCEGGNILTFETDYMHQKSEIHSCHSSFFPLSYKMETVGDLIFFGSKITADSDCRHEIKRCLLLGTKAMTNLDSILKSREITLMTKFHIVETMVAFVVMCRCESWTIKKSDCQRIDAFELWCLRVPWTARRSNQLILKEINLSIFCKDWCWSWSANTLATWCE